MFLHYLRQIRYNKIQGAKYSALFSYFRWKRYNQPGVSSMTVSWPWLTFKAIDFLKKNVRKDMIVFEYGGGGSTLFWLNHVDKVYTVEHDGTWFKLMKDQIPHEYQTKWTGLFCAPDQGLYKPNADASNPLDFASLDEASKGLHYKTYVEAIKILGQHQCDILLIDGRSRTSCIHFGFPHLKSGGYLIIDNAEREHYFTQNQAIINACELIVTGFGPVPFSKTFSNTHIYRKK